MENCKKTHNIIRDKGVVSNVRGVLFSNNDNLEKKGIDKKEEE